MDGPMTPASGSLTSAPPFVQGFFVQAVHNSLLAAGVEPAEQLRRACVAGHALPWNALLSLLEEARHSSGRPALGLEAASHVSEDNLSVFGPVLVASRTLREAITHCDALTRRIGGCPWELDDSTNEARFTFHYEGIGVVIEDLLVGIGYRITTRLLGVHAPAVVPLLTHAPPPDLAAYSAFFGGRVDFQSARSGLLFPRGLLDKKRQGTQPGFAAAICELGMELLAPPGDGRTWEARVEYELQQLGSLSQIDLNKLGNRWGLTGRALQRRLANEGVRLRDILSRVRLERSRVYLSQTDLSVQSIAEAAGYADASTFYRAFKRWTGSSPRIYRTRLSDRRMQPRGPTEGDA